MSVRSCSKLYSIVTVALAATVTVGCTNSLFGNLRKTTSQSVTDSNGQTRPPLMVAQIVKNNANPDTTLDLIGDGSGEVGRFCLPLAAPTNMGPSTCRCVFSWTRLDGTHESAEVESTYHENNLLRCGYTGVIPKDVGTVKIKVLLSTIGAYSNEVDFGIDGSYGTSDATNPDSYIQVQRYQCRDTITLFQPTPGSDGLTRGLIYDPWQSDDPAFTYPLDFYATNRAQAMAIFASKSIAGWNCPGNADNPSFGSNFRVYSVDPLPGTTDRLIHNNNRQDPPQPGSFDRSGFYLARSPSSVFKVPLNAYVAPTIISGGTFPSLGFGAAPIASGVGTERCPAITLPTGTHWVKVWQFRATLPKRTFVFSTGIQSEGAIICNPPGGIPADYCNDGTVLNGGNTTAANANGLALADRILFDQKVCLKYQDPAGIAPCGRTNTPASPGALACTANPAAGPFADYTALAFGTDIWHPYKAGGVGCPLPASATDFLHICDPLGSQLHGYAPYEVINTPRVYTPDLQNPRSDYLFVVTPPEVNSADMIQENRNATPYVPIRYPSVSSCQSPDPNSTNCPGGFAYGVDMYDVSIPSNPPAGTRQSFPLCAIQPDPGVSL